MSSLDHYTLTASPVLRDFQQMTLSLTDEDDDDQQQHSSHRTKQQQHNLFVFSQPHTTPTPTPRFTPNQTPHSPSATPMNSTFQFDANTIFSSSTLPSLPCSTPLEHMEEITPLSDDENESNPFLLGLAIKIPPRDRKSSPSCPSSACSSSGYLTFNTMEEMDALPDIQSCDEDEDDEYSNNYFVDDTDADEYSVNDSVTVMSRFEDSQHSRDSIGIYHDDDESDHEALDEEPEHLETGLAADDHCQIDRAFLMRKYKYIENIGIGAFGIVDKVWHRVKNQYLAIKQSRSIGDEVLKQFRNEFTILQEFAECEHIIDLLDYGLNVDANQICLGLEYMDIGSLKNRKTYSLPQIKYICKCVLSALQALHDKLYVHNDLKPENILISSQGKVKLIDFGCTMQMQHEDEPLTKSIGSIRYLSYEKRFKSPIRYTTKSDIYSFGITIAEIFNGEHVRKTTPYDHYFMTTSPTLHNNDNVDFADFIAKCVEAEPNQRWSASQLLNHPFLADTPETIEFKC